MQHKRPSFVHGLILEKKVVCRSVITSYSIHYTKLYEGTIEDITVKKKVEAELATKNEDLQASYNFV